MVHAGLTQCVRFTKEVVKEANNPKMYRSSHPDTNYSRIRTFPIDNGTRVTILSGASQQSVA